MRAVCADECLFRHLSSFGRFFLFCSSLHLIFWTFQLATLAGIFWYFLPFLSFSLLLAFIPPRHQPLTMPNIICRWFLNLVIVAIRQCSADLLVHSSICSYCIFNHFFLTVNELAASNMKKDGVFLVCLFFTVSDDICSYRCGFSKQMFSLFRKPRLKMELCKTSIKYRSGSPEEKKCADLWPDVNGCSSN